MYNAIYTRMKENEFVQPGSSREQFLREASNLWPVAKGSVSIVNKRCMREGCRTCLEDGGHPAAIYTYRSGGKLRCMHVRKDFVPALRAAIENGRKLEELLVRMGRQMVLDQRGGEH